MRVVGIGLVIGVVGWVGVFWVDYKGGGGMLGWWRWVVVVFGLGMVAGGRAEAQVGVYALGTAANLSGYDVTGAAYNTGTYSAPSYTSYGATVGIYYDFATMGPFFKLGMDARVFHGSTSVAGTSTGLTTGGGGVRVMAHFPKLPIRPYAQGEIGGESTNFGNPTVSGSGYFIFQVQMGVDVTVMKHVDVRGEYGRGKSDAVVAVGAVANETLQTYSGGVVLRF